MFNLEFSRNGGAAKLLGMSNTIHQRMFAGSEVPHGTIPFSSGGVSIAGAGQCEKGTERD
jgi:hypothetical protein